MECGLRVETKETGIGGTMKGSRFKLNQNHAPIHEALETFRRMRVVPFDVPGHKRGRGNPELTEFLGQKCVGVDVNSMKPLDNLCHPGSGRAGSRCFWSSTCISDGGRYDKLCTDNGVDGLQARR